jgi:hypothetical protein
MNRSRIYGLYQALNLVSAFSSHHAPLVTIVVGVKVLTLWFSGWLIWSYLYGGADWIKCTHRKLQMTGQPYHCAMWTTFYSAWTQNHSICLSASHNTSSLWFTASEPSCSGEASISFEAFPQTVIKSLPLLTNMLTEINLIDHSLTNVYYDSPLVGLRIWIFVCILLNFS